MIFQAYAGLPKNIDETTAVPTKAPDALSVVFWASSICSSSSSVDSSSSSWPCVNSYPIVELVEPSFALDRDI